MTKYILRDKIRIKERKGSKPLRNFHTLAIYSCAGAPTGQVEAQVPHSMQASASITYLPSPSEIAPTGHAPAQAPQEMHSSLILYAIVFTSALNGFDICIITQFRFFASKNLLFLQNYILFGKEITV